ncbi:MAG: DUF2080 family transposase-associated protein [Pseudomonadota bacterium]
MKYRRGARFREDPEPGPASGHKVHLVIMGRELLYKKVAKSGKSGRVYLPLDWVGKTVKIVRLD